MKLELEPDVVAGLTALADAHGLSVEDYLKDLIETELTAATPVRRQAVDDASGMIWEDGLFIYGAGTALSAGFLANVLRRSREERSQHLLGRRD
jgi:hypothetical protein